MVQYSIPRLLSLPFSLHSLPSRSIVRHTNTMPLPLPVTISPARLRVERPPFRVHHTFPLQHTSEYIDSHEPLPRDWLFDMGASSPSLPPHAVGPPILTRPSHDIFAALPPIDPRLTDAFTAEEDELTGSIHIIDNNLDSLPRRPSTPIPIPRHDTTMTGGTCSSSDSSVDTPLSERRKKSHQAFLTRTKQYQSTPTPHHPLSESRMLASTPTPSKRHLDGDASEEEEVLEPEEEGFWTSGAGKEGNVEGSTPGGKKVVAHEEKEEVEQVEEVEKTPVTSSPFKTSDDDPSGKLYILEHRTRESSS